MNTNAYARCWTGSLCKFHGSAAHNIRIFSCIEKPNTAGQISGSSIDLFQALAQGLLSLINKIIARISGWISRQLSYVGSVQLIISVLASVTNNRYLHFVLSKTIIKKIEQICCSFLWKGDSTRARGAKVAWKEVCLQA